MQSFDWIVLGLYMVSQLALGLYCSRRSGNSVEDYFLAGRKLTWWLLGTSMVATAFASDTPLFITKLVRQYGISGAWYYWNASLNGLLAAFMVSYLWRRTRVVSDAEFRELRYSGRAGKAVRGGWAIYWVAVSTLFSLAWVILAMVKISKAVFDLSDTMTIAGFEFSSSVVIVIGSLLVTGIYSAMSGFWGVIVTDFIQFFIAFVGTALLAWYAVSHVGGLDALRTQISALPEAGPKFFDVIPSAGPVLVVFWVGLTVQWWSSMWVDGGMMMAQRSLSAKSEKHAEIGRYWGHLAQIGIIVWPWIIAALCSLIIFPISAYPQLEHDPESAYPMLILKVLPVGLRGVVVAGFLLLMLLPGVANIVPLFILLKDLSLLNTLWALIIVGVAGAQVFNIFVLRNFIEDLPKDLFEAAEMDGASHFQQIMNIVIPMSAPIIGTLAILAFLAKWNDFLLPLIVLRDKELFTLGVGLIYLDGEYVKQWGQIMAAYFIASVPLIIIFLFTMCLFVKGLSAGAIKG